MINDMAFGTRQGLVLSLLLILVTPTHAQKQERVCQVVARVNGEIITRHAYLTELRDHRVDFSWPMLLHGKSQDDIDAEFELDKPTLLDDLIDELLLAQRGKELGFDGDVELKRLEDRISLLHPPDRQLEDDRRRQGYDLDQARASGRMYALGRRAIQTELLEPIFQRITDSQRRDFYNSHKERFMLPATVTLSEVFLPYLGQSESEVAQRAVRLLAELRAGADFFKAVADNTPVSRPTFEKKGSIGTFRLDQLRKEVAVNVSKLSPSEYTQPMQLDSGYQIIRLDTRTPATPRSFEDPSIQEEISRCIAVELAAGVQKGYVARLREKAIIELCPVK